MLLSFENLLSFYVIFNNLHILVLKELLNFDFLMIRFVFKNNLTKLLRFN